MLHYHGDVKQSREQAVVCKRRVKNNKHARMREAMHHFVGYVDGSQRQIVT